MNRTSGSSSRSNSSKSPASAAARKAPTTLRCSRPSAARRFGEQQLSAVSLETAMADFCNRLNHVVREQAGKTW